MGKHSRRKRSKSKSKNNNKDDDSDDGTTGSSSKLLIQLRHANPDTRHAALAALMNTIMDPDRMSSKVKIHVDLLQAIRERVMDKDLECAQLAANCLSNYLRGCEEQDWDTTSSWTVVFLQRLQECVEEIIGMEQKETTLKRQKRWWALTMQCLSALCNLVEMNHKALTHFGTENAINILLSVLNVGARRLEKSKNDLSADTITFFNEKSLTFAAQTLHSALDDNTELVRSWKSWDVIRQNCKNQSLPISCRLHCVGCLVTAWLLSEDEAKLLPVIEDAIPLLHSTLDYPRDEANALVEKIRVSHENLKKEEADSALEKEIIRKVTERKEPAREIARRQKSMDKKKKIPEEGGEEEDTPMEDDGDEAASSTKKENTNNAREIFESAKGEWYQKLAPLELALEILANLTGLRMMAPETTDDMDMEDWGPEQEKNLLEGAFQNNTLSPLDISLLDTIVKAQIPNRLVNLLKLICQPMNDDILPEISASIRELQSKCGACLGNCVGEHFPNTGSWTDGLLQELRSALDASEGNPSIANAMAAGLRSRSSLRKQCQPSDLAVLLQLTKSSSLCQKEAVEILGILCSCETHEEEVNRTVCSTLMAISSKKAEVMNEVLNALMDIYGNDDCHPFVFESKKVLAYFQQITPTFKRMIQCDRDQSSIDEVEQWKETLLNASRFISYKKGQC